MYGDDNDLPLVILHWRGWSKHSWKGVAELLSKQGYAIYVPDLPWFGETTMSEIYDTQKYADFVSLFVDTLGLWSYYLIWHSNWWRISIKLATEDVRIKQLILINSAWIAHPPGLKRRLGALVSGVFKLFSWVPGYKLVRSFIYRALGWHDYLKAENPLLKKTFLNVVHHDVRDLMKSVSVSTLIVRWSKDTYTPLPDGEIIYSLIANSTFVVCEGERHGIHLHNPELLTKHIVDFLS